MPEGLGEIEQVHEEDVAAVSQEEEDEEPQKVAFEKSRKETNYIVHVMLFDGWRRLLGKSKACQRVLRSFSQMFLTAWPDIF